MMMDVPPPVIVASAVPPAPIVNGGPFPAPPRTTPVIVSYEAESASCGGATVPFTVREAPLPSGTSRYEPAEAVAIANGPSREAADVVLSFSIDAQGRAVGIRRESASGRPALYVDSSDVEPALAVSRFAAGKPRIDCRATFRASTTMLDDASSDLLARFVASGARGSMAQAAAARLRPAGGTCNPATSLRPLVLAYPDARKVALRPGAFAYSTVTFDVDASGKPVDVRIVASNDGAHGVEVMRAIGASRFAQGAAKGCVMGTAQRGQGSIEPPPRPPVDAFRRAGDTCAQVKTSMKFTDRPTFPLSFRKRGVEGWAIVRYDVAPWGDPGNIEVVAAEPAALFGEVAKQVVRSGKAEASGTGASGCLAPVRFKLADDDGLGDMQDEDSIR